MAIVAGTVRATGMKTMMMAVATALGMATIIAMGMATARAMAQQR